MIKVAISSSFITPCLANVTHPLFQLSSVDSYRRNLRSPCPIPSRLEPILFGTYAFFAILFPPTLSIDEKGGHTADISSQRNGGSFEDRRRRKRGTTTSRRLTVKQFRFYPVSRHGMSNETDWDSEIGSLIVNRSQFTPPYMYLSPERSAQAPYRFVGPFDSAQLIVLYRTGLLAAGGKGRLNHEQSCGGQISFTDMFPVGIIGPWIMTDAAVSLIAFVSNPPGIELGASFDRQMPSSTDTETASTSTTTTTLSSLVLCIFLLLKRVFLTTFRTNIVRHYNRPPRPAEKIDSFEKLSRLVYDGHVQLCFETHYFLRALYDHPEEHKDPSFRRIRDSQSWNPPRMIRDPMAELWQPNSRCAAIQTTNALYILAKNLHCNCHVQIAVLKDSTTIYIGAYTSLDLDLEVSDREMVMFKAALTRINAKARRRHCTCQDSASLQRATAARRSFGRIDLWEMISLWLTVSVSHLAQMILFSGEILAARYRCFSIIRTWSNFTGRWI